MLNWIVWNGTVFDIEILFMLKWIVYYKTALTVSKPNIYLYLTKLFELELFD